METYDHHWVAHQWLAEAWVRGLCPHCSGRLENFEERFLIPVPARFLSTADIGTRASLSPWGTLYEISHIDRWRLAEHGQIEIWRTDINYTWVDADDPVYLEATPPTGTITRYLVPADADPAFPPETN